MALVAIVVMIRWFVREYCFVVEAELRYCCMDCVTWVVHKLFLSELLYFTSKNLLVSARPCVLPSLHRHSAMLVTKLS